MLSEVLRARLPHLRRYYLVCVRFRFFIVRSFTVRSFTPSLGADDTTTRPQSACTHTESKAEGVARMQRSDQSGLVEIQEGRAKILFPSSNEVFYNPVQEFNRDLRYKLYMYSISRLSVHNLQWFVGS